MGSETVAGAIVGGRLIPGDDKRPQQEQVTLLLDSGDLRNFDLTAVASVRFTDPKLQAQFKDYLAALMSSRSKEKRSVYIDSTDAKSRQIMASYMIPTPVWKSSYRLIFDAAAQPMLEGWAIVDNTTGEDWTNVQLVAGVRPADLVHQPVVRAALCAAAGGGAAGGAGRSGRWSTEGTSGGEDTESPPRAKGGASNCSAAPPPPLAAPMQAAMARSEMQSSSRGQRQRRATWAICSNTVSRRRSRCARANPPCCRSCSRRSTRASCSSIPIKAQQHPTNAAELTNSTGKTLDGGPITVFDGGAYAGEALVETLKTGDKRLISYAVDLGTRITTQVRFQGGHGARNPLAARHSHHPHRRSRDQDVHHPQCGPEGQDADHRASGPPWLSAARAQALGDNRLRLPLRSEAGRRRDGEIPGDRRARLRQHDLASSNLTPDVLITYIQNKALSDAARKQLEQIATLKNQIAATDAEIQRTESDINDLVRDRIACARTSPASTR